MSMLDALDDNQQKTTRRRQPKKEPKEKTWSTSFRLYQEGKTPGQIAAERSLTVGTVLGHLARYLPTGEVQLDDLVSPEHQQAIKKIIAIVGTSETTTAIKALCPPDVTYEEIRLILSLKN